MAAYHLDGENPGLYDDGLLRRFMLAEDMKRASLKLDRLAYGIHGERPGSALSVPSQQRAQAQAELDSLVDLACQRGEGPGGDVERFAAQLVYDSALAHVVGAVGNSTGTPDGELVREVLSLGAQEMMGIVFAPMQHSRMGAARALSQVAALQEALDEADNELLRMREEAEIVSIHAASTRAMMALAGANPAHAAPRPPAPPAKPPPSVDVSSTQCDMEKEHRLHALEQQLAHELSACEKIAESHLHLLGDVVRAHWNRGAEVAELKSKLDLAQSRAQMCERLKTQVSDAAKQAQEDQGRIMGLGIQIKALQETAVGEGVLLRDLAQRDAEILHLRERLKQLLNVEAELSNLQAEHTKLEATVLVSRKMEAVISRRCNALAASEAACKETLAEASEAGRRLCQDISCHRVLAQRHACENIDLENRLKCSTAQMQALDLQVGRLTLALSQEQVAHKDMLLKECKAEREHAETKKALADSQGALADLFGKYAALHETFTSVDRLLLAARAGCTKRDEQLQQCVLQLSHLEEMCAEGQREAQQAAEFSALLRDENDRLRQQVTEMNSITPRLQSAVAEWKKRAEDAECRCQALDCMLVDLRALVEGLHISKEELETSLCVQGDSLIQLQTELDLKDAMNDKVIQLSDSLEASQSALVEARALQISLQQQLNAKESVAAQTNNELEALAAQLQCVTDALTHSCTLTSQLQEEKAELMQQIQAGEAETAALSETLSSKDAALSQREYDLDVKESEVGLLRVSVSQALNEQLRAQKAAEAKEAEAAEARMELLKLRSSTWDDRGAVSLAPTPRDSDSASQSSFDSRPVSQREPRHNYRKGLF